MDESSGATLSVGKIDRGTIGDINTETKTPDTGNQSIRTGVHGRTRGHGHHIAVHLLGRGKLRGIETAPAQILRMSRSKSLERCRAIGGHIDPGDTGNKGRTYAGQAGQRLENLHRVQRFFTVAFLSVGAGAGFCFFEGRRVSFFFGMVPLRTPGFGLSVELSR